LNADPPTSDLHHFESVSSTYHRVLRDSQQSATFTEGITQRTIHVLLASGDRPSHRDRHPGTSGERPLPRHRAV